MYTLHVQGTLYHVHISTIYTHLSTCTCMYTLHVQGTLYHVHISTIYTRAGNKPTNLVSNSVTSAHHSTTTHVACIVMSKSGAPLTNFGAQIWSTVISHSDLHPSLYLYMYMYLYLARCTCTYMYIHIHVYTIYASTLI